MDEDTIDLEKYWILLKRWAWLLILVLVLGAGAGYGASILLMPVYEATTKVMVTRGGQDQPIDIYSSVYADQLTQTYMQLLQTETVLDSASEKLGVDLDKVEIKVEAIRNTNIIEVSVENTSPLLAATIANTLVDVLIEQNETIQSGRYDAMEASLTAQKSQLEGQIAAVQNQIEQASIKTIDEQELWLQEQIAALEAEAAALPNEISAMGNPGTSDLRAELEQKEARLEQVNVQLPLYKQSYTDLVVYGKQVDAAKSTATSQIALLTTTQTLYLQKYQTVLSNLETVRLASMQNTPSVVPIEVASVPDEPIRPRVLVNTALGGLVGLMVVAGVLVMKEYLDNSVKTSDDIEQLLGFNPIGYILEIKDSSKGEEGLYVSRQPRSPVSEAFRTLRTNIEFAGVDKPIKTILITSPEPATGKTMVAANLAIVFAQKGKRVLLLDADLRRPQVHKVMKLQNRVGFTNLLLENLSLKDTCQWIKEIELLTVLTSGGLPPNPAELLGSNKMERILAELGELMDVIIIDSPPSIVADAQILAAKVDGVILVVQPEKTLKDDVKTTVELLKRANAHIIGVVLNRISRSRGKYYNRYHYKGYEYIEASDQKRTSGNLAEEKKVNSTRKNVFRR